MKKKILFVALTAILSGALVSCGKSTKGKMDGDWKVENLSTTTTDNSGGSTETETMTITGTTITMTSSDGSTSVTTTGTVSDASWSIKKDGTWERTLDYTINYTGYNIKTKIVSSGNWDFAKGVGDFKKNERVLFSTMSETYTAVTTSGSVSQTQTNTNTYNDGEMSEIFVITESKGKSLKMKYDHSNTSTSGSNSNTYTESGDVSLVL